MSNGSAVGFATLWVDFAKERKQTPPFNVRCSGVLSVSLFFISGFANEFQESSKSFMSLGLQRGGC
jgi:hypothetical protein